MKQICLIIAQLFLAAISISAQNNNRGVFIKNITIISADAKKISTYLGNVVIEADRIVYAENKRPVLPGSYNEIDGTGKYLVPGLIDSHVHLSNIAGLNRQLRQKYPELVKLYFEQLPKSFLYFGYTTLIDLNNYAPQVINKIKSSPLRPDIYTCGEQLQVMNDFMMEMEDASIEERYQSSFVYDKYNRKLAIPDSIDKAKHAVPMLVSKNVREQQGICLKMAYEDEASGLPVSWQLPDSYLMKDIIAEAKKYNVPVMLHATSYEAQKFGVETGVHVLAHSMWNWSADPRDFDNKDLSAMHKKLLLQIANKQIAYQPTFRAITAENDLLDPGFVNDTMLEHVYLPQYLYFLKTEEGQWGREKILGRANYLKEKNPAFYKAFRKDFISDLEMFTEGYKLYKHRINTVVKFLEDNHANLIFGTDGVAMNMYTNPPGYNGFLEMKHWADAGISLETLFKAVTINNARTFHIDNLYGSVEKNKIANLVILDTDPLKDVNAYNKIHYVIMRGEIIKREKLSAH